MLLRTSKKVNRTGGMHKAEEKDRNSGVVPLLAAAGCTAVQKADANKALLAILYKNKWLRGATKKT